MHWIVTLAGSREDVERLMSESPEGLSVTDDPRLVHLEILDPRHPNNGDEARSEGRALIDAAVRHINGYGRLRWGRIFGGLDAKGTSFVASDGEHGQVGFVDTAYAYLEPEEFGDMVARLGFERPSLPDGLNEIRALDVRGVLELAETHAEVARVLRLIELTHVGDGQIDWVAGYATLEVIEQSACDLGVSGESLGWWAPIDRRRFRQTANSFEAVGMLSRHPGRRYQAPKEPMSPKEGSWFVRAVAARWITWLSGNA